MRWIKHNFATVLAICLVIVFGVMAVVIPNSMDSQAAVPEAPNVTLTDNKNGTYSISGTDSTMEYNTVSATHTIWKDCTDAEDEFKNLTNAAIYYFRVKAADGNEAGAVKEVWYGTSAPSLTSAQNTGTDTVRIEGLTTDMEYNTEGPLATSWTKLTDEKIQELQSISETGIYYIRTAAKEATSDTSATAVSLPCRVAILIPQITYNENGTYAITGLTERFEYKKSTEETWTQYSSTALTSQSEGATYQFRVIATADEAAGEIQSIAVKSMPAAPTLGLQHNADGTTVKITGVDETMEYTTDPENTPTAYIEGALDSIAKPSDQTFFYYVRVKATDTSYAGYWGHIEIPLQGRPDAPNLTITANNNETSTVKSADPNNVPLTTIEYNTISADAADENWTTCGSEELIISEGGVYYFRVKANGGIPAGNVTRALILILKSNEDNTVRIDGIDESMEYRKNDETTWTSCSDGALDKISESGKYYVRLAGEESSVSEFDITITVISQPEAPDLDIKINDNETATITSTLNFTTLEYNKNSATAEDSEWTACSGDSLTVSEGGVYYFRVKAAGGTPAGAVTTVLILIPKDNGNNSVRIDGINETMWYKKDTGSTWIKYVSGCELDKITETSTYYIKMSEDSEDYTTIKVTISSVQETTKYAVTFESTERGSISGSGEYEAGENVTIKATTNEGYTFSNWEVISGGVTLKDANAKETSFTMGTEAVSIRANFTANTYTITLQGETQQVTYGQPYGDLPEPIKAGYTFEGWYLDETFVDKVESTTIVTIAKAHELYPKWIPTGFDSVTTVFEWDTTDQLAKTITVKTSAATRIDWGDGRIEDVPASSTALELSHTYSAEDVYTVSFEDDVILYLDCSKMKLTTLSVSGSTEITTLICSYNQLEKLDISKNRKLITLNCLNNRLTDLDITANTKLTYLDCGYNKLTSLDVSANTELTHLSCHDNQLPELDVSENTALTYLDVSRNAITEIDVSENTALTYLDVAANSLTEIDISANKELTNFYCGYNQITTLDISKNANLSVVCCAQDTLTDLYVTATQATNLTVVEEDGICVEERENTIHKYVATTTTTIIQSTGISWTWDTTGQTEKVIEVKVNGNTVIDWGDGTKEVINMSEEYLTLRHTYTEEKEYIVKINDNVVTSLKLYTLQNINETTVTIVGNQVTALNVSNNTVLEELFCSSNWLTELDVSNNTALERLACDGNKLTELDVSNNEALEVLFCENNKLSELDVKNNMLLRRLECANNQLTELNVKNNEALEILACGNNKISELDVSSNAVLSDLSCHYNELSELDVSKNTALKRLTCHYNKLSELNVSENTALKDLYCGNNNLSVLDVSKNVNLSELCCVQETLTTLMLNDTQKANLTIENQEAGCAYVEENTIHKHEKTQIGAIVVTITLEGETREVTYGEPYGELPTPTKADYVFGGWYLDEACTIEVKDTTPVTTGGDHTLYAKWIPEGFEDAKVTFVWDTATQLEKKITVKTSAATMIDWGDGTIEKIPASSTELELSHTYVTEGTYTVRIQKNTIVYLDCSNMKLETLDVSDNTKLTVLICSDNLLEKLDVSENTELVTLDCSNNQLEKLDISENTALKNLYCGGNELDTLNIKENTKLVRVCCVQESLRRIYVTEEQKDNMTVKNETTYCHSITATNVIHKYKDTSIVETSDSGSSSSSSGSSGGGSSSGSSSSGGGSSVTYPTGSISSSSWKNKFTDVATEDWYYEAIKYVNKRKYFSGTTTTTFSPNDPMSREMIVTVLYNMEKRPITYGPNNYWDVPSGSWSEPAIVWASKYGIVSGYPQGHFAPAQAITREELAAILKKYSEYKKASLYNYDYTSIEPFADKATISDWAVEYMVWATSNGLMKGTYGYLLPQKSATRAEVAAMIMNYCEK